MQHAKHRRTNALALALGAVCALGIVLSVVWSANRGRSGHRAAGEKTSGKQGTLTVIGSGSARVPPDEALVTVGIRVAAASAQEAGAQGNVALQRILEVLKEQGIAERQIHTTRFNIMPEYRHDERGPEPGRPAQYRVTGSVHMTVNNLPQVGGLLDTVIEAGEDDVVIEDVSLLARDISAAEARARRAAFAHAREKAEQLAREATSASGGGSARPALSSSPGSCRASDGSPENSLGLSPRGVSESGDLRARLVA